ncbi:hypothetical protein P43SY_004592 [Pythium insidiosum]|uniref:Large ribosomal subunit protein bL33c n=1 Tax=Pythium insidiosum TaxID=114742 RepID=A0AAD5LLQ9_PYTIN|nr:hypothetical protein P43SY_004592 [Pythium insidiosum]
MMQADSFMEDTGRLSAVAASVDVLLDERKMYTVTWRDASTFGFTVTPVNSDHGTVLQLARRTAKRSQLEAVGLQDVVPGDMLIAIGDERVYHLGAENATKYLRSVPKPVQLLMQLSPYGGAAKNLPDLAVNEYNYRWEDGPLGLVLTYDPQSKLPMVKRLSDKANDVVRRDVQVGDQLIYANDVPSSEYSMDELMSILREMPKPIVMRFRKPLQNDDLVELPELAEDEYEFLWEYGPLGLVIGQSRNGLPFVRAFTGKGTSPQLGLVQENDEIVMVNERSAIRDGFTETMNNLMHVPKPAVLRFRRAPVRRSTGATSAYQQHRRTMSRDDVKPPLPDEEERATPRNPSIDTANFAASPLLPAQAEEVKSPVPSPSSRSDQRVFTAEERRSTVPTIPVVAAVKMLSEERNPSDRKLSIHDLEQTTRDEPKPLGTTRDSAATPVVTVETAERATQAAQVKVKASTLQYEDTADLVAEPLPKASDEKPHQGAPEIVALPPPAHATPTPAAGNVQEVQRAVAKAPQYEDTAELFAEPAPKPKAATPVMVYEDTAELIAAPRPSVPKAPAAMMYEDTAELVADAPAAPKPQQAQLPRPSSQASLARNSSVTNGSLRGSEVATTPRLTPSQSSVSSTMDAYTIDEHAFYQVKWTDGPFGSTVREADSTTGPVMLITKRTGKQTCAGLRRVAVGDILVRIGDRNVSDLGFEKATRYLRKGKARNVVIKMLSSAGTGFFYTTTKNPRNVQRKLTLRKYDPVVRQHVIFNETKIKKG